MGRKEAGKVSRVQRSSKAELRGLRQVGCGKESTGRRDKGGGTQVSGVPHRAGQHGEMAESPALCSLGFPGTRSDFDKLSARCPTLLPVLLQLNTAPPGRVG